MIMATGEPKICRADQQTGKAGNSLYCSLKSELARVSVRVNSSFRNLSLCS